MAVTIEYLRAGVAVWYIAGASAMSSATTTACSVTSSGGTPLTTFRMYEFSGVNGGTPIDVSISQVNSSDSSSTVNAGTLATSVTDLIFVSSVGGTTVGSGYTAGVVAGDQYKLNQAAGSIATAFGNVAPNWATVAVAFKSGSAAGNLTNNPIAAGTGLVTVMAGSSPHVTGVSGSFAPHTLIGGGAISAVDLTGVSGSFATGELVSDFIIDYGNVVATSQALPSPVLSTYFYFRATGVLTPLVSGKYTIGVNCAPGCDVYIGTQPIVNALNANQTANSTYTYTNSKQVTLQANVEYPIVVEWQVGAQPNYQLTLMWTPPGSTPVVIPLANLSMNEQWWDGNSTIPTTTTQWFPSTWY